MTNGTNPSTACLFLSSYFDNRYFVWAAFQPRSSESTSFLAGFLASRPLVPGLARNCRTCSENSKLGLAGRRWATTSKLPVLPSSSPGRSRIVSIGSVLCIAYRTSSFHKTVRDNVIWLWVFACAGKPLRWPDSTGVLIQTDIGSCTAQDGIRNSPF